MKFVSSLLSLLLISSACLATPPVYTTSDGKSIPLPDGVLDPTTNCGLNLGACSKNKENDFCRDIVGFANARLLMNYFADLNEKTKSSAEAERSKRGKGYPFMQQIVTNSGRTRNLTTQEEEFIKNKKEIASLAAKQKDYIQRFVAVGLTRSQINNIPFPGDTFSIKDFYDSQEFRCKNASQPSTPLYTAIDGSSSPIPNGVLDPKTDCGLNLKVCWVQEEHKWKKQNAFCSDIKKLAGLKHEIEEKGKTGSLASQPQDYIDALEAIGLTQEQIKNIPAYAFEEQEQNMDQYFYCRSNNTPNKPPKKTLKEKVAGFFRGNKGQK